jgi:hypothetical protein
MFRQILFTQWRWGAPLMVLLGILAIAIPVGALSTLPVTPSGILDRVAFWGWLYPMLAVLTGLLIGTSTWAADHRGNHVYALTLPVPRWYYALLRYGAGVVLTVAVGVVAWIGALFATSGLDLPTGLQTFAGAVAVRFLLTSVLVYSVVFAMASGTNRTAGWILASLGGLILAEFLVDAFGSEVNILETLAILAGSAGGPFALFSGTWMLVAI